MASENDFDVPETGAVFTFGKSQFADNIPNKFWIRDDQVIQVCCGDEHTALVAGSGRVFTFGSNSWGQLGLGHTKQMKKPTKIKALKHEKVTQVSCGRSHTLLCTESGKLYSFGANGEGQLGLGHTDEINRPAVVESLDEQQYLKIAAGADHSAVLTENGLLYVWGSNSEGQLGLGDEQEAWQPVHLQTDEKVISVACGYYHTAFVTESGNLYTFGETEDGKLGLGYLPDEHRTPQKVDGINGKVVHVSCGGKHTVAITDSGKLYTFGDGTNGQLGHGTSLLSCDKPAIVKFGKKSTRVKKSSCGESHTAVITAKGQLFTFGDGRHGKLALGEENFANQFKPILVDRFMHFIVDDVSCGGCHMLIYAKPRLENGDAASSDEKENEQCSDDEDYSISTDVNGTVRDSIDLNGTLSARNRRREKLPDPGDTVRRTLPPLDGTLTKQSSPLLRTSPNLNSDRLSRGRLPAVGMENESLKKQTKDSGESLSESSDADRPTIKPLSAQSTNAAAPIPKPRPTPRKSDATKGAKKKEEENEEINIKPNNEEEDGTSITGEADVLQDEEENSKNIHMEEGTEQERVPIDSDEDKQEGEKDTKRSDEGHSEKDEEKESDERELNGGKEKYSDENKHSDSDSLSKVEDLEEQKEDSMKYGKMSDAEHSDAEHMPVIKAGTSTEAKNIPVPVKQRKSKPLPSNDDKNKDSDEKKDSGRESQSESEEDKKRKQVPKKSTKKKKSIKKEGKTNLFGRRKVLDTDSENEAHQESDATSTDEESIKRKQKSKMKKQRKIKSLEKDLDEKGSEEEESKALMGKKTIKKGTQKKKGKKSEEEESENSDSEHKKSEDASEQKISKSKLKETKRKPQTRSKKASETEESEDEKKPARRKQSKNEPDSSEEETGKTRKKKPKKKGDETDHDKSEDDNKTKHQSSDEEGKKPEKKEAKQEVKKKSMTCTVL